MHLDYIWSSQLSCEQVAQLELVGLSVFVMFAGCTDSMKQYIVNLHFDGGVIRAVLIYIFLPLALLGQMHTLMIAWNTDYSNCPSSC